MYNKGKISDLIPIDIYEIKDFVANSLDEIDYFNCNVEELVSLRDYLIELKEKQNDYSKLITDPLKSIQEKNPWCTDVQPAIRGIFKMEAKSNNYPSIYIGKDNEELGYNGIALGHNPISNNIYLKRYSERNSIVYNSRDELLEIEKIVNFFGFNNENEGLFTASKHFLINPYNFDEVHVKIHPTVDFYHKVKLNKKDDIISKYCGISNYDDKILKKYADNFAKKLYLSKKIY